MGGSRLCLNRRRRKMRIVFFGTPQYVLPILIKVHKVFKSKDGITPIVAVVTQKAKPAGREKRLKYSAIDAWAFKRKIPIYFYSQKLIEDNVRADIGILAAYGEIIPEDVIKHFEKGILNVHPSHLPRYRGASPVQAAIAAGETTTGVSILKLDNELDHGPVVSGFKDQILENDTTASLRNRLFERSAEFISDLIPAYIEGKVRPKEQNHKLATFTTAIKKAHAHIPPKYIDLAIKGKSSHESWQIPFIKDFETTPSAEAIERFIRAMHPWPEAWTDITISGKKLRLKLISAGVENEKLVLDRVQMEGKNPVSWQQFQEGYKTAIFE